MDLAIHLKKLRKSRGLSQRGLAIKMGVSNASISDIENGTQNPKIEMLEKFAKALDEDLSILLNLQRGYNPSEQEDLEFIDMIEKELRQNKNSDFGDFKIVDMTIQIPILGTVRAGELMLAEQNIEGYITLDRNTLYPNKDYYALKVKGDSMDKLFPQGTTLVVEKTEIVESNQIAVVGINGYDATVKRVSFADNNIALIPQSNNPAYETKVYNIQKDEIHIMGRVVQAIRFF